MHRIFQDFIDCLSSASNSDAFRSAMSRAAAALDLSCFAYLSLPEKAGRQAGLISNYPSAWTSHYLQKHYERFDPVIIQALRHPEPFEWGLGIGSIITSESHELFEEAARFGIRRGFTIPIHSNRGPIAAVTFAADERQQQFERIIGEHARALQLMAMYFHAHAHRKKGCKQIIGRASLSPLDALHPVYLIQRARDNRVQGCVRLLPSTGPTMLRETFPVLLDGAPVPASSSIWESSRFAIDLPPDPPKATHGLATATYELFAGMIEFGLSRQLTEIITVTDARMERILRRAGWCLRRIGAPRALGSTLAVAGYLEVSIESLTRVRAAGGLPEPVLWAPVGLAAA